MKQYVKFDLNVTLWRMFVEVIKMFFYLSRFSVYLGRGHLSKNHLTKIKTVTK